jgi:hypothetical protein
MIQIGSNRFSFSGLARFFWFGSVLTQFFSGFGSVFAVWLCFSGLARFFQFGSILTWFWLGFFLFFSVWVRFGSVFLVFCL